MFHLPSFFIGYLSGAGTVLLTRRFGPAFSELATAGYGLADSLSATLAAGLEDVEDLLAEARSRASAVRSAKEPPRRAAVLRVAPKPDGKKKGRRATKATRKAAPASRRKRTA